VAGDFGICGRLPQRGNEQLRPTVHERFLQVRNCSL
jgi:hypothetical protein